MVRQRISGRTTAASSSPPRSRNGWEDRREDALHHAGSPWENGYNESFDGSLCDELLNGEIFYSFAEAEVLIEAWCRHYNTVRPHSSLGYRPPAPKTATRSLPASGSASLHLRPAMTEHGCSEAASPA